MTRDRVEHEGLTGGDWARYALLALFASLVVLIGLGDRDHAYVILALVWAAAGLVGLVVWTVRRRRL